MKKIVIKRLVQKITVEVNCAPCRGRNNKSPI